MFELMNKGGSVMWIILACSVIAAVIFLERLFHLHRARIGSRAFLEGIFNILRRGNIVEAVSICEETPGPEAHIVRAAILRHDEDETVIRKAILEAGMAELPRLERRLNLLATLAQITPLLGLLGTVLGMIDILATMEQNAPLVQSGDLAGGLWKALLTTAAGLVVAIPAYAGHNFLAGRVEVIVQDMERTSAAILTFLTTLEREKHAHEYRAIEPAAR